MFRLRPALLLAAVLAPCLAEAAFARQTSHARSEAGRAGQYDYYVMALSWSPTYCQTHPDEREQCGRKGYGFVLHGLWPQNRKGFGPEHCATIATPEEATIQHALAFMPSRRLIAHEWETHGACSGLEPAGYFELADRAFAAAHGEFVRHKTTRRAHYAAFDPGAHGAFDTVLWNEAGEITETTFGNIAARIDGRWITPPLTSGLLPGVGRALALREGRVAEAVLRVRDVPRVQAWAFVNSLRGWLAATLD